MTDLVNRVSVALANSDTPCRDMGFDEIDAIAAVALRASVAPELLEALGECVDEIKNIWNAEPMSNESKAVLRLAAHALAKAEGQS